MAQIPALKLTINDERRGINYIDSVHRIIGIQFDSLTGNCNLTISIYANQEMAEAGKKPLIYNGFSEYFMLNFARSDIAAILDAAPSPAEIAANLTIQQILGIRMRNYLMTLGLDKCPFDYTLATPILLTIN